MKADPNLPHPVVSNCVEYIVKERHESAIVLEEGLGAIWLLLEIPSPH